MKTSKIQKAAVCLLFMSACMADVNLTRQFSKNSDGAEMPNSFNEGNMDNATRAVRGEFLFLLKPRLDEEYLAKKLVDLDVKKIERLELSKNYYRVVFGKDPGLEKLRLLVSGDDNILDVQQNTVYHKLQ